MIFYLLFYQKFLNQQLRARKFQLIVKWIYMLMKTGLWKWNFFWCQGIFLHKFSKMGVKMNLRIITKNHQADLEKGFLTKSISKPYGRSRAMPSALELSQIDWTQKISGPITIRNIMKKKQQPDFYQADFVKISQ